MELRGFDHLSKENHLFFLVWHLDADGFFPGNGRFNPDIRACHAQRDIVGQAFYAADFYAGRRLQFKSRNGWAIADIQNF